MVACHFKQALPSDIETFNAAIGSFRSRRRKPLTGLNVCMRLFIEYGACSAISFGFKLRNVTLGKVPLHTVPPDNPIVKEGLMITCRKLLGGFQQTDSHWRAGDWQHRRASDGATTCSSLRNIPPSAQDTVSQQHTLPPSHARCRQREQNTLARAVAAPHARYVLSAPVLFVCRASPRC